jgi:hypothetical protein
MNEPDGGNAGMLTFAYRGFLAIFLLSVGAAPTLADTYFIIGQAHPRFHLEIAVNGTKVKSVTPNSSKAKIFIKQISAGLITRGRNTLSITYRVLSEAAGGNAPVPSFRVRLVRKKGVSNRKGKRLAELRGPRKPYRESFSPTTLRKNFVLD